MAGWTGLPQDCGLALIGDADCGHIGGGDACSGESSANHVDGPIPYLVGVVLDPAWLWKVLLVFEL